VHDACPLLAWESVQEVLEKLPPLVSDVKVTVPVGVVAPPAAVSVTVAVQDVSWPRATISSEQVRAVLVARGVTVMVPWPLLAACVLSPP
jgi:hypothetical protein